MDVVDIFEDALFAVFEHHQPAHGDPGAEQEYVHACLPPWCALGARRGFRFRIPAQSAQNTHLFAHYQWDAGAYLADLVADGAVDVRGRRIVELGAGTALPSLAAAAQGASVAVATDYPDPDVLAGMARNAALLCEMHPARTLPLRTAALAWGDAAHADALRADGPFDVVLAADVLWVSSQHAALLRSVAALLAAGGQFVLVAGFHTGRPAITRFLRRAAAAGLVPDESAAFGGLYERSFQGAVRAWQGAALDRDDDEEMGDVGERAKWVVVATLRRAGA